MAISRSAHIHVTDHTYRPIEGALVSAGDASAHTDEKGHARLEIPAGVEIKWEARGLEGQARFVEWKEASRTQLFTLGRAGMPYYYRGKVKVPCEPLPGTIGILAKAENARNKKKGAKKSDIVDILYIHLNQKYSGRKFSRLTVHSSRDRSRFEGKECLNLLFPGHP